MNRTHLVWFRNDLRLDDNPALAQACQDKEGRIVACFFVADEQWSNHDVGDNQKALILRAVKHLSHELSLINISLIIRHVPNFNKASQAINELCHQLNVTDLHFNVEYPINERHRDKEVVERLPDTVSCRRYVADSLLPPWEVKTQSDAPFKVFTPFSKASLALLDKHPIECFSRPEKRSNENIIEHESDEWPNTEPQVAMPDITEKSVSTQLEKFIKTSIANYKDQRDFPAIKGTSQLSPALAIGVISPRRCFVEASRHKGEGRSTWLNEIIWRDFYRSVMWHFPHVAKHQGFNKVDRQIRWNKDTSTFERWKQGETGVPIVDAAMRQLNETGWMHNRLRMIVASFLTKNLWVDWREGERYFANQLFDFDFASNNGGWQWSASVGTDAAPYFRVFNPASQGKRFDPDAEFIRKWIPELARYSAKEIHSFETNRFSKYPKAMVDLKDSRKQAIDAFKVAKEQAA
ncbi:deoxyribodipyrimidine photo-lyase [Pleionea sediminis]|uniref:deoxyribodipyrimidine photo-lyase n=1 Tax=Pleionea sediminis TaxID=2569479 RepID=UPI0011847706|nr:deoxyribodipyrimidine photo-lyase [Pleionea sediminis]